MDAGDPSGRYAQVLNSYQAEPGEQALYEASLLSRDLVRAGIGPEEIVALHVEALEQALAACSLREQARCIGNGHQFLLEVMIGYGLAYREYLEMKVRERDEEAERADRARLELLAIVAHELRTPLTAALGTIDLASRSLSRGRADRVPGLLGTAREALARLSRLTANLARATQDGPPPLAPAPHDLCKLLSEACVWVEPATAEKGIALVWDAHTPELPVDCDADAMLSVFGNLLSNAVRYTPAGGRVCVACGVAGDEVWVDIADTGIGMTPEVKARIFEKFYRAREARDVEAQGLGLGLALVGDLVAAHGGRVEVESEPGSGSAFRVVLPRRDGSQEERGDRIEPLA